MLGENAGEPRESKAASTASAAPSLESLAPKFNEEQHGTYLRHLEEQVANPKNLNIALTGRYGVGKSSILDEFGTRHQGDTLRLGISTLDPSGAEGGLTNRIQKELVKQLLYQASPGRLRHSRFNRIAPRSPWQAVVQSASILAVVGSLLAFVGWLPPIAGTGSDHLWLVRTASWAGFGMLLTGALTVLRLVVFERHQVSDVSAAGASVKLTTKDATYFDEYLDEIVYFFDTVAPRYVIYEDLDRFDDPKIFEALRELNTLLNSTDRRRRKGVPLRFIYAIKDSLFEQLGSDTRAAGDDAAAAETVRANRTKFFEVVIPVVPFVSHRNARDLLASALKGRGVTDVDRRLIDLVARHGTDMRLLHNICNEYLVFSERLLYGARIAPGLSPTNLFALVAYKNFHLEDFEQIARRNSDLDRLYDASRDLVTSAIEGCERRKRELGSSQSRFRKMRPVAKKLGEQLLVFGTSLKTASQWNSYPHIYFQVGGRTFESTEVSEYTFWGAVAESREVRALASLSATSGGQHLISLMEQQLGTLFPEAFGANAWDEVDAQFIRDEMDTLDHDITFLRGADFVDLAGESRFALTIDDGESTFAEMIDTTLKSQMARELVKQGYLDRNFALYASQFYGHFSGIDVANFLVRNVQTNTMDIQYPFEGPSSIANLLAEAPEDFTRTFSAFNLFVLDHLFNEGDERAHDIVDYVLTHPGPESTRFVAAFLNADQGPDRLAASLSRSGWRSIFAHLVGDETVPDDRRVHLVDAALLAADSSHDYDLNADVGEFIVANYTDMTALTQQHEPEVTRNVDALLEKAQIVIPDLEPLDQFLRRAVVQQHRYALTADNIRCALGVRGAISLDAVREDVDVYGYCREDPETYLTAVEEDSSTPHTLTESSTLLQVLQDVCDEWNSEAVDRLLTGADAQSRLIALSDAPQSCWSALTSARLFRPTLPNITVYLDRVGTIDQSLADLLAASEGIETVDEDQAARQAVAVAVLNAGDTLKQAAKRVQLALTLDLSDYLEPSAITPVPGDLLALLIENDLIEDSAEAFAHFKTAGWEAIEPAIARSEKFREFLTPDIAIGLVPELFASDRVPAEVRETMIKKLDEFVPGDDGAALRAAARYALSKRHALPVSQVRRIATVTRDPAIVVPLLAVSAPNASEIVEVLMQLPEPYSYFTTKAKTTFRVPDDEAHRGILTLLRKAGIVTSADKLRKRSEREVKLAG